MHARRVRRERLAPIHQETLDAIARMRDNNGLPPTLSELVTLLGVTDNAVRQRLRKLETEGYIRRLPRTARGIVVIDH